MAFRFGRWYSGLNDRKRNAEFVSRIYGDNLAQMAERLDYIFHFSELGDYFNMPVKSYSSGMRSRLLFGISMAFDFDVYLIDEITAVGDVRFRKRVNKHFMTRELLKLYYGFA